MSLSFGDIALSLGAGAAKEYNAQEAEKRQSATRMQERSKELAEMQQYRVAETRLTNELARDMQLEQDQRAIEVLGGVDHPSTHIWAAMKEGIPQEIAVKKVAGGWRANMSSYTKPVKARDTLHSAQEAAQGDSRLTRRFAEFGNHLKPYEEAPVDVEGIPLFESGPSDVSAWMPSPKVDTVTADGVVYQRTLDDSGNIQLTPLTEKESGQSAFTEVKDLYTDPEGNLVRLVKRGNDFFLPGSSEPVDMKDFTVAKEGAVPDELLRLQNHRRELQAKIADGVDVEDNTTRLKEVDDRIFKVTNFGRTDADERAITPRVPPEVGDAKGRVGQLAEASTLLDNLFANRTAMSGGIAGALVGTAQGISTNLKGFAELMGVNALSSPEELNSMYSASGYDIDQVYAELERSNAYWRGKDRTAAGLLVYSIANVLKDAGANKITTEADVKRAINLVGNMTSDTQGIAAYEQLRGYIDIRAARYRHTLYEAPGLEPRDRSEQGFQLLKLTWRNMSRNQVLENRETGEILAWTTPTAATNGRNVIQQALAANPERDISEILSHLPANIRPRTVRELADIYGTNGFLVPKIRESRNITPAAQGQL